METQGKIIKTFFYTSYFFLLILQRADYIFARKLLQKMEREKEIEGACKSLFIEIKYIL